MSCNAQQEKAIFKEMLLVIDAINYQEEHGHTWDNPILRFTGGMLTGLAKALDAIGYDSDGRHIKAPYYRHEGVNAKPAWVEYVGDYVLIEPKYRLATLSKYLTDRINEIDNLGGIQHE